MDDSMLRLINERHNHIQKEKQLKEDIKYVLGLVVMSIIVYVFLICTL